MNKIKLRRKERKKQSRINCSLKRRLFGHLFIAPCHYCREIFFVVDLTIEHLVPLCLGGTNDDTNIALACAPCNNERGRQSWVEKQEINRKYYAQYYPKH